MTDAELNKFINKNKKDKKNYLLLEAKKIKVPKNINKKLHESYKLAQVLNKFINKYITKVKSNSDDKELKILKEIENFKNNYTEIVLPEKIKEIPTNLYQMSGALKFASINLIVRSLSTEMGALWENIADCSNLSISTDKEFGLKLSGIDIIFLKEDEIFYAQIKTMEGTLTGSQAPRSKEELSLHKNSYFVAAFETGTGWTFNSKVIPRIKGKEFWSLLGLDYNFILEKVKKMIKEIEDYYYNLISTKN
jgi:hypothetical protein